MAKLSAHGREIARLEVEHDEQPAPAGYYRDTVPAERQVFSFRSDGHIMRREVVKIHAATFGGSEWHDYGWKLYKRFSERKITADRIRVAAERYAAKQAELTPEARVTLS
jgi:hypothetical protein